MLMLNTRSSRHHHSLFQAVGRLLMRLAGTRESARHLCYEREPARVNLLRSMRDTDTRAGRIDFSSPDGFRTTLKANRPPRTSDGDRYFPACDH